MRNRKGSLLLEFTATSIFLLGFALVTIDMAFLLYGANINDKACRDACRAAAQANNAGTARQLADATISAQRLAGDTIGQSIVTRPVITSLVYQDFGAQRPPLGFLRPDRSPFVQITTQCNSTLPFAPPSLLGNVIPGSFTFRQTYTFPIVLIQ